MRPIHQILIQQFGHPGTGPYSMNLCTWYLQADQRRKRLEGLEAYHYLLQLVTISWYYSNSPWHHPTIHVGRVFVPWQCGFAFRGYS
jgi:hypothetical protein